MRSCTPGVMLVLVVVANSGLAAQEEKKQPAPPSTSAPSSIMLMRTCDIVGERGPEAARWALDIIATAKGSGSPFKSARVYSERFGHLGRLHWLLEFADWNAVEMFMGPPPPKIQEMLKQAPTLLRDCKDTMMVELQQPAAH